MTSPPPGPLRWIGWILPDDSAGRDVLADLRREAERDAESGRSWGIWKKLRIAVGLLPWALRHRWTRRGAPAGWASTHGHRVRRGSMTMDWFSDVRFALRMALKKPLSTLAGAFSLGIGIAAATAVTALAYAFLVAPLPFEEPQELLAIGEDDPAFFTDLLMPVGDFVDLRDQQESFLDLAAWTTGPVSVTTGDRPVRTVLASVSPGTLPLLGARPTHGLVESGDLSTDLQSVVLDHDFWRSEFGGDPSVVGRTVRVDGEALEVIGVTDDRFELLQGDIGLYRVRDWRDHRENRSALMVLVVGRLAPGVTADVADARIGALIPRVREEAGIRDDPPLVFGAEPLRSLFPGPSDTQLVYVLLLIAGFVLLLATVNVANLQLARAEGRGREVAVRSALGAGRRRLVRQLLTEGVLLASVGAAVGVLLAVPAVDALRSALPPVLLEALHPDLSLPVLGTVVAIAVMVGIILGMAPALHILRGDLGGGLREGSRGCGAGGRARSRLRAGFVAAQVALALALLVGAGSLFHLADSIIRPEAGIRTEGQLAFEIDLPTSVYGDPAAVRQAQTELVRLLEAAGGVEAVALMSTLPRAGGSVVARPTLPGEEYSAGRRAPLVAYEAVAGDYFETLGMEVLLGSAFEAPFDAEAGPEILVNEAFVANRLGGVDDPIGRTVRAFGQDWTICGVVADALLTRVAFDGPVTPTFFLPAGLLPRNGMAFTIEASGDPTSLIPVVREALATFDPDLAPSTLESLDRYIETQMAGPIAISRMVMMFAGIALFLAALGIYAVIAHSVTSRRREFGVRMALGAGGSRVVASVTGEGARLTALGMVLGAPLAYLAYRGAEATVVNFSAEVGGLGTQVVVVLVLGAVVMLSALIPALRAASIAPAEALRDD